MNLNNFMLLSDGFEHEQLKSDPVDEDARSSYGEQDVCVMDEDLAAGHALSSSPPRACVTRSTSSADARDRQLALHTTTDLFNVFATIQWVGDNRCGKWMSTTIVHIASVINDVFELSQTESLWAEIARECPHHSCKELMVAAQQKVRENADVLVRELLELRKTMHARMAERAAAATDHCSNGAARKECCQNTLFAGLLSAKIHVLDETLELLHQLAAWTFYHKRRYDNSVNRLVELQKLQKQQFAKNFDALHYGTMARHDDSDASSSSSSSDDETAHTSPIACQLDCGAPNESDNTPNNIVRLECCNFTKRICERCLCKHAFEKSTKGAGSSFSCPYCRADLQLYTHLDTLNAHKRAR